jgi:hypothetical protein
MSAWQPIESAPLDGTFLVHMNDGSMHVAKRLGHLKNSMVIGGAFNFDRSEKPTHWMPLPAAPRDEP